MSKNYAAVSQQIVDAIGGANNIGAVTHCMTRLRFVLNDKTVVDLAKLKPSPECWVWYTVKISARLSLGIM